MGAIKLKRVYDVPAEDDGYRVLVDRIWPRGISKDKAKIDNWMKEIAPPTELRKWFNHEPEKFQAFKEKYTEYLTTNHAPQELLTELKQKLTEHPQVTLVYAAKDEIHNQAVIIKEVLLSF